MSPQRMQSIERWVGLAVPLLASLAAVLVLLILIGHIQILDGALCGGTKGCTAGNAGGLGSFVTAANSLDGPASVAIGSVAGLGVLMGGAMLGIAHPSATKVLAMSAGTGLVVVLGNGIIK
jgi:hypothetical protein